jgi:hypothetical protein
MNADTDWKPQIDQLMRLNIFLKRKLKTQWATMTGK